MTIDILVMRWAKLRLKRCNNLTAVTITYVLDEWHPTDYLTAQSNVVELLKEMPSTLRSITLHVRVRSADWANPRCTFSETYWAQMDAHVRTLHHFCRFRLIYDIAFAPGHPVVYRECLPSRHISFIQTHFSRLQGMSYPL